MQSNSFANYGTTTFQASYKDAQIYGTDAIPVGRFEKEKLPEDGGCKNSKLFVFTPQDSPNTHYQYIVKHCNQDAHITPRRIDKHPQCFDKHMHTIIQYLIELLQSMSTSLSNYTDVFKVHIYTPFAIENLTPVNSQSIKRDTMNFPLSRLLQNSKFSLSNDFTKHYSIPLSFNLQNQCTTVLPFVSKPCEFTCSISTLLYAIYKEQPVLPVYPANPQQPWGQQGNNAFNGFNPVPPQPAQQSNPFQQGNNVFNGFNAVPPAQQVNPFQQGLQQGNNAFNGFNAAPQPPAPQANPFQQQGNNAFNAFNAGPQQPGQPAQPNGFGAFGGANTWANAFKK